MIYKLVHTNEKRKKNVAAKFLEVFGFEKFSKVVQMLDQ